MENNDLITDLEIEMRNLSVAAKLCDEEWRECVSYDNSVWMYNRADHSEIGKLWCAVFAQVIFVLGWKTSNP